MPAISSASRAILNLAGMSAMRPALDAPQVQQDALLSGSFGSAVYDSVSSTYIAYGYGGIPFSRMLPSASYGHPGSHHRRGLQVQGGKLVTCDASSLQFTQTLQHTSESTPQQPQAAQNKRNKKKKAKKSKKTIENGKFLAFFIILGRTIDSAVSKRMVTSRRLVTRTVSSLLFSCIFQRASESASLSQQPQATHERNKNKKKPKKPKKANTTTETRGRPAFFNTFTAILGCITDTVSKVLHEGASTDQACVFGILREFAASNSSHGDADEYLRSAFNAPDARSPPLVGWSDYEADETLGCHPPVQELDNWMFPQCPPSSPFSPPPSPSEDALAGLTADADPVRPFGFIRTNYVERVYYDEAYENAMLNVAFYLPFSMEPFIYPWQIYCFPHEQLGRYPPVEESDEWTGILEPRPMLAHDMREGPGPPMFVDIGDRWDE